MKRCIDIAYWRGEQAAQPLPEGLEADADSPDAIAAEEAERAEAGPRKRRRRRRAPRSEG